MPVRNKLLVASVLLSALALQHPAWSEVVPAHEAPVPPVAAPAQAMPEPAPARPALPAADAESAADAAEKPDYVGLLARDLAAVNSLSVPGWEAASSLGFVRAAGGIVTPDGTNVSDAGHQSSSVLLEYGCTDVVTRRFRRGQRACDLAIYRFVGADNAYAAYSNMRQGATTVVVRGEASSEDDAAITFVKGNVFCSLTTSSQDDSEAKDALTRLANDLVGRLGETNKAGLVLLHRLPVLDRVSGSEKMFAGPISLRRYTYIPFMSALSLEHCRSIVSADYAFAPPLSERLRLFIIEYGDSARAKAAIGELATQAASDKVIEEYDERVYVKTRETYVLAQLMGSRLAVITGARKKFASPILARQLR